MPQMSDNAAVSLVLCIIILSFAAALIVARVSNDSVMKECFKAQAVAQAASQPFTEKCHK